MKKYLFITFLCFLLNSVSLAEHANEPYEPNGWDKFLVNGSDKYYKFESELIEDKSVKKEIKNTKKTGLISYLLFEDNKIKIDEENLPEYIRSNNGLCHPIQLEKVWFPMFWDTQYVKDILIVSI